MRMNILRMVVLLPALLLLTIASFSQQRAAERVQLAHQQGQSFAPVTPVSSRFVPADLAQTLRQQVTSYSLFEWTAAEAAALTRKGSAAIELTLPRPGADPVTLELVEVSNFSSDFSAVTAAGEKIAQGNAHYYQGIVKGEPSTLAAISIFDNEIAGFFSGSNGNYVVGRVKNTDGKNGYNIVYNDNNLTHKAGFDCSTAATTIPLPANPGGVTSLTNRCVRMMFETEYDYFVAFGYNSASVNNFVTNLFNQIKTLYNNDGVSVVLSQVIIWTTNDPYNGGSTAANLAQFQSVRTSYTGDVGQLITTRSLGGGQAAVIYGLCGAVANTLCVSGDMYTSFPNVPTYSWEVMVTTHEFGHLLGSRHTHACVWNGNNTAIDGCSGFVEGSCSLPGIPPGGGTLMSYCHIQSVGINFSNGFGPQPAAQIRNSVEASGCLGSCGPATPCNAPTSLGASSVTSSSAVVSWAAVSGAVSYTVEYKAASSGTWLAAGTTGATSLTLSGLAAGTAYDWRVLTNCSSGSSGYSQSQFTTLAGGGSCDAPTGLSAYGDCGYAEMYWNAVSGAISYTVEYKKSASTTWLVAESATTNTWTSISGSGGAYNWRVRANCSGGSSVYATGNFSVLNPASPACNGCFRIQNSVKINPQPANTGRVSLTMELPEAAPNTVITIYNQFGTPLYKQTVNAKAGFNNIQLDVSKLQKGSYTVQMQLRPVCPRMATKLVIGD